MSVISNIFNDNKWGHCIYLSVMCDMWNIPIRLVTLYLFLVINMFYGKVKCVVVVIANGWPNEWKEIMHYSVRTRIDNDNKKISNANEKRGKLFPVKY